MGSQSSGTEDGIDIRIMDEADEALALGIAAGLEYAEGDEEGLVVRWGAYAGGRLVGTVALRICHGMALVSWMAVDERMRGRGIGRRLLRRLENEARARGESRLWAAARAPQFYFANGFVPVEDGPQARYLLGACLQCQQYGESCTPLAAVKDLNNGLSQAGTERMA